MPVDQCSHSKAVADVVYAWTNRIGPHTNRGAEIDERRVDRPVGQRAATGRNEETRRVCPGAKPIASCEVGPQRVCCGRVHGDEPRPTEFGVVDRDDPAFQVDIGAGQAEGLTDPHPARSEETQQCFVGRRP